MSALGIDINKILVGGGMVLAVGLLVISILVLVGMGYLTSVTFNKKKWEELTTAQRDFARMAMVLFWMGFILNVLYIISLAMGGGKRTAIYYF